MDTVLAKGVNFVFAREFVQKEYPNEIWESLINQLPNEDSLIWQNANLENAYPFATFKTGVFTLTTILDSPEIVETARMYEYIADRSLNTLYKAFFRVTNPTYVINNFPRLWDRFFTAGEVEVSSLDKRQAFVIFRLPEIFIDWLPPACLGYSKKAIELAGGQHFTMHQLERIYLDEGQWEISYEMGWR